jgi:hypothetical protein
MYPGGCMDIKNPSTYTSLSEKTIDMIRCNSKGPRFIKRWRIFYFKDNLGIWPNEGGWFTSTA